MKTSAEGRAFIEAFEGLFLKAYQDIAGVWTIGYGHTSAAGDPKVTPRMKITAEEADKIFAKDITAVESEVLAFIKIPLTQSQFDCLVSFHFNTGALKSGSVDDKLNRGDVDAAMATLMQYVNSGENKNVKGLIRRRKAEKLLFEGKVKEALDLAGVKNLPNTPVEKPITKPEEPQKTLLDVILNFILNIFKGNK